MKRILFITMIAALLIGCEGKQGPMGPAGSQGEAGPGTRIVYTGMLTSAAAGNGQVVPIPDLRINDMPSITAYICDSEGTCLEMNMIADDGTQFLFFEIALIKNGSITLFSVFVGSTYRIVVIR